MDQHVYVDILQNVMLPYAGQSPQAHNQKSKKWFADNIINIMELPPQSPDLNPTENLWIGIKKALHTCNPTSNEAVWMVVKESWEWIPFTRCQDLVDCMPRRCAAVIANKGYSTKY